MQCEQEVKQFCLFAVVDNPQGPPAQIESALQEELVNACGESALPSGNDILALPNLLGTNDCVHLALEVLERYTDATHILYAEAILCV